MPCANRKALLNVHRRKFDQMLHACCFGDLGGCFIERRDLRTSIEQEEPINSFSYM
jgi:hypothetical protein